MSLNTELVQVLSAEREEGTLEHTFLRTLPSLAPFSSTTLSAGTCWAPSLPSTPEISPSPRTQAVVFHLPSHWAGPETGREQGVPPGAPLQGSWWALGWPCCQMLPLWPISDPLVHPRLPVGPDPGSPVCGRDGNAPGPQARPAGEAGCRKTPSIGLGHHPKLPWL